MMSVPNPASERFPAHLAQEEAALVVVFEELVVRVVQDRLALEVGVVVDEVHLDAGSGDGRHLDDQGVVRVVHVQVHAAQSDDLVELVTMFVDFAKTWYEHANSLPFSWVPWGSIRETWLMGVSGRYGVRC